MWKTHSAPGTRLSTALVRLALIRCRVLSCPGRSPCHHSSPVRTQVTEGCDSSTSSAAGSVASGASTNTTRWSIPPARLPVTNRRRLAAESLTVLAVKSMRSP